MMGRKLYGLRIVVKWVDTVLVSYVHPLPGPFITQLPAVKIAPGDDPHLGVIAGPVQGLEVSATYSLTELTEDEHRTWSQYVQQWDR